MGPAWVASIGVGWWTTIKKLTKASLRLFSDLHPLL